MDSNTNTSPKIDTTGNNDQMNPLINVVLSFSGEIFDLLPILSKVCFGLQGFKVGEVIIFTQSENIKAKDFAHFNLFANIKIIKNIDLLCLSMSRSDCGIFSIFKDPGEVTASKIKSLLADPSRYADETSLSNLANSSLSSFTVNLSSLGSDLHELAVNSLARFLTVHESCSTCEAKKDVLIASFYTPDAYYKSKAEELKYRLDFLELDYCISEITIPEGLAWPDVCRKKVQYMLKVFLEHKHRYKKIIWMDVDCLLDKLPSFLIDFEADLMGFGRSFRRSRSKPKQFLRFWEPCFFVFATNDKAEQFLKTAADLEVEMQHLRATDDYFIEESWRRHKDELNFFVIPGEYCDRGLTREYLPSQYRINGIFFIFGSSGNVQEYMDKVEQHTPLSDEPTSGSASSTFLEPLSSLPHLLGLPKDNLLLPESTLGMGCSEIVREQVKSLRSYELDGPYIPLFWWIRPAPGNMGDWLSPYIISKLFGLSVKYVPAPRAKLISLGSIGKLVEDHQVAWGTGISDSEAVLSSKANFLAVRGPYTAKALLRSGGKKVDTFGDPGILMNRIFKPKTVKNRKYKFGFVRHYIHQDVPVDLGSDIEDLNINMSSARDLEHFITRLASYDAVLTTSLHVIILCHAYKIPCRLVTLSGQYKSVPGNGIKYKDFYLGAGLKNVEHANVGSSLDSSDFEVLADNNFAPDWYGTDLIESFRSQLESDPGSLLHFD